MPLPLEPEEDVGAKRIKEIQIGSSFGVYLGRWSRNIEVFILMNWMEEPLSSFCFWRFDPRASCLASHFV